MIVTIQGCKFEVRDQNDHIQKHWVLGSFYEANKSGLLSYMLREKEFYKGKKILDIGACVGNHTVFFEKMLGMKVTSFEPHEQNFDHLRTNCDLNALKATIHNVALGETKGMVSAVPFGDNVGMVRIEEGNSIPMTSLDNLAIDADVIKIDVEGYNKHVLRGATQLLKGKKLWFIECDNEQVLQETDSIMTYYGYKRADVVLNHTPTYIFIKL